MNWRHSPDEGLDVIVLVQGVLNDDRAHHAFAAIPNHRYTAFKKAEQLGNYDLRDFGEVLSHAHGLEPTLEEVEHIINKYGANPNFEDELREKLREIFHHLDNQKNRKAQS